VTDALGDGGERTRIRRLPEKQVTDRAALNGILDAGRVAHVATTDTSGRPYVLPVAYARDGGHVLVHGSTGSRLFRALADGVPTCLTVTLLDGLVLARSAFESSMHYRSAMVFGSCRVVPDADVLRSLQTLTEHLLPGRWAQLRPPTARELAATSLLRLPLTEWSVKVSDGWPDDPPEDLSEPVWAGVVPLRSAFGTPLPAPDLRGRHDPPTYLSQWTP
jgi:nitroimidazol reductase NimA-like FMN-containing flavoprotein (pyridoxamine 5'-phosphate oxidase superfamily)